jgi:hypothetical protein
MERGSIANHPKLDKSASTVLIVCIHSMQSPRFQSAVRKSFNASSRIKSLPADLSHAWRSAREAGTGSCLGHTQPYGDGTGRNPPRAVWVTIYPSPSLSQTLSPALVSMVLPTVRRWRRMAV